MGVEAQSSTRLWSYWNLLDLTPDGRGEGSVPIQNYEHAFSSKNVLGEKD